MTQGARVAWTDLEVIASERVVFRLIRPSDFVAGAAVGKRLLPSALPSNEYEPKPTSYGASVFVKELLANGLADVHAAHPKWVTYRVSEVPVGEIVGIGVEVRLSVDDCSFATVKHAHASLIGVTRQLRPALLRLIEKYLKT